jgi:hypothetical protein
MANHFNRQLYNVLPVDVADTDDNRWCCDEVDLEYYTDHGLIVQNSDEPSSAEVMELADFWGDEEDYDNRY